MKNIRSLMIGFWPIFLGILLMGNSLYQHSAGQLLVGTFSLLAGIILTLYFFDEKKSQQFIQSLISGD